MLLSPLSTIFYSKVFVLSIGHIFLSDVVGVSRVFDCLGNLNTHDFHRQHTLLSFKWILFLPQLFVVSVLLNIDTIEILIDFIRFFPPCKFENFYCNNPSSHNLNNSHCFFLSVLNRKKLYSGSADCTINVRFLVSH